VDRLLDNPVFADLNDPRFKALRKLDFESAIREALALEVSSKKNDWTIPTDDEIDQLAGAMVSSQPKGYQAPEDDEPAVEIIWEGEAKGSKKGVFYKVTFARVGDDEPAWSCTCPASQYGKAPPGGCKHVVLAMREMEAEHGLEVQEEAPEISGSVPEIEGERSQGVDPET